MQLFRFEEKILILDSSFSETIPQREYVLDFSKYKTSASQLFHDRHRWFQLTSNNAFLQFLLQVSFLYMRDIALLLPSTQFLEILFLDTQSFLKAMHEKLIAFALFTDLFWGTTGSYGSIRW